MLEYNKCVKMSVNNNGFINQECIGSKKKTAFITVHVGENFGSALQAIATQRVLEQVDTEPTLINYIPPRVTFSGFLKRGLKSPKDIVCMLLKLPCFLKNKKIFESFVKKHSNISVPIYKGDDFTKKCPKADCYITGSDQVWNFVYNEGFDEHYFFQGIHGRKISYAASMGMTELNEDEKQCMTQSLKDYDYLSVREESGREVLSGLGFDDVQVLIDPTLMLDKDEWAKYASPRLIDKPYLFVYIPYNASDEEAHYKVIRQIAAKKSLKIVSFSLTYLKDNRADITLHYPSPADFLSLMLYADYILTNSFHGTAFSINLNKDFAAIKPNKFESRITNILTTVSLMDRLVNGLLASEVTDKILSTINYDKVNAVLDQKRSEAIEYLKSVIK